uniref:Odorant receptor n=1 Tax=Eucryptorrhynchus brandti TaxID=436910 RepID=A0A8F4N158_EUCBR|nr:odorant receptor 39 [Eucryptorrhynchus brandti]
MNIFELVLFHAPIKANICTTTERMVRLMVENRLKLCIILMTFVFSSGQMVWFFYRWYNNHDMEYACNYAPILFTCFFAAISIIQVALKHSHFRKSIAFIRENFWSQDLATEEARNEMSDKIGYIKLLNVSTVSLTAIAAFVFMPFNGIHYNQTLFPFMDFLGNLDMPEGLKKCLAILIYPLMFPTTYCVAILGVALCFYACNFKAQAIMIKWLILDITKDLETSNNQFDILDDIKRQEIIKNRLITCIKHHNKLCRFAKLMQGYFYYTMIWHVLGVITLSASIIYMIFFQNTTPSNQLAIFLECIILAFGTYMYCFMGESFQGQFEDVFDATKEAKWYYFNVKNRKLFSIFIMNLRRSYKLDCAGIFCMNLELTIWILNKIFALVSVLTAMKE